MSRPAKIISLLLVVAVLAAAVYGVAWLTAQYDPSNPEPGLYVDGRMVDTPDTMLTIGEHEVPFSEYRHYYLLLKSYFESMYGGSSIWADDPDGELAYTLRNAVEVELVNLYAWLDIAEQNGIELTEQELADIEADMLAQQEAYGEAYPQQLEELFFTDEATYLSVTQKQALSSKVQTEYPILVGDEIGEEISAEADEEFLANMITAKHILVMFDTSLDAPADTSDSSANSSADASAETPAEAAPTASYSQALLEATTIYNQILAEVAAGGNLEEVFDTYMWEYTEDMDGLEANPDGYTFQEGDMVDEFYAAAIALPEYGMSTPVETAYGFHILLRLPLSEDAMQQNSAGAISTAVSQLIAEEQAEVVESLTVVGNEYYEGLNPYSIQ